MSSAPVESVESAFLLWEHTQRELDGAEQRLQAARDAGDVTAVGTLTIEVRSLKQRAEELLATARSLLQKKSSPHP